MLNTLTRAGIAALLLSGAAVAQTATTPATPAAPAAAAPAAPAAPAMDHSAHAMPAGGSMAMPVPEGATPSTRAYVEAMNAMHEGMMIDYTGDADVDFVRGMIPHHQGAVEMAKIVLEHGKDPELKKLAEDIVKAQETEIAFMQEWLKKHGN